MLKVILTISFIVGIITASSLVEICEKPAVQGNSYCMSQEQRWTFNSEDEQCVDAGNYNGCFQTENNFETLADCETICGGYKDESGKRQKTYPDGCYLPAIRRTGKCSHIDSAKFHFDKKTKMCKSFPQAGCGANANSFKTLQECQKYCGA